MRSQHKSVEEKSPTELSTGAAETFRRKQPLIAALLEKATTKAGCILCHALNEVEQRALFTFLYEGITTPDAREEFVRGGGFCPRHFEMAVERTRAAGYVGPFEIASVCQLLLNAAMQARPCANGSAERPKWRGLRKSESIQTPVERGAGCMLCTDARSKEQDLVAALEQLVTDPALAAHVEANGLCQHHSLLAQAVWAPGARRDWLLRILSQQLKRLKSDIDEFLRKHDHRFRGEPAGAEADAVQRALKFLLGMEAAREGKGR